MLQKTLGLTSHRMCSAALLPKWQALAQVLHSESARQDQTLTSTVLPTNQSRVTRGASRTSSCLTILCSAALLPEWQALAQVLRSEPAWQEEARTVTASMLEAQMDVADRYSRCGALSG